MAKKQDNKPARAAKNRPANAKNGKAAEAKAAKTAGAGTWAKSEKKGAARAVGPMSDAEIGHVAGDVWSALGGGKELTLVALKKEVAAPGDMVVAAIGWLAREGKVKFVTAAKVTKISLR